MNFYKLVGFLCGFTSLFFFMAFMAMGISDDVGIQYPDGYPLTLSSTYLWLTLGMLFFASLSYILLKKADKPAKKKPRPNKRKKITSIACLCGLTHDFWPSALFQIQGGENFLCPKLGVLWVDTNGCVSNPKLNHQHQRALYGLTANLQ